MHSSRNGLWLNSMFARRILPHTHAQYTNIWSYQLCKLSKEHDAETPATFIPQTSAEEVPCTYRPMYLLLYIFMRYDSVKKPLQLPYDGPFLVLNWTDKHFTLDMAGKKRVVSLDRLKLAYMDTTLHSTDYNSAAKYVRTVHLPMPPQLLRISHQNLQLPQL